MEAKSIARYVRVTPRKVDQVLRLIRGMQVDRAQEVLGLTPRPIARQVGKVLKSAVANATKKEEKLDKDELYVKEAVAGAGPILKRFLPRAHGRATRFWKRTSHITIVVTNDK
jgi:large subunit ribosomal protein L22